MSAVVPTQSRASDQRALGDLFNVWGVGLLVSVIVGAGLGPALRGARQGLDRFISLVDQAAGATSQFAAVTTWLLMVHVGMLCVRLAKPRVLSLGIVLASALPVVILMSAQRTRLGLGPSLTTLACASLVTLAAASHLRHPPRGLRAALLLGGASLLMELLRVLSLEWGTPALTLVAGHLRVLMGALTALSVLFEKARDSRSGGALLPVCLFIALLCAVSLDAGRQPGARVWVIIAGRGLSTLIGEGASTSLFARVFMLGLSLTTLAWTLVSRLRGDREEHAGLLCAAALALTVNLGPTPLTSAAATLVALTAIVLSARRLPPAESL